MIQSSIIHRPIGQIVVRKSNTETAVTYVELVITLEKGHSFFPKMYRNMIENIWAKQLPAIEFNRVVDRKMVEMTEIKPGKWKLEFSFRDCTRSDRINISQVYSKAPLPSVAHRKVVVR